MQWLCLFSTKILALFTTSDEIPSPDAAVERVRPCLHEGNELCYNFIKIVTWECRHQYSYLGANFLIGSHYPWFSEGTGPVLTPARRGSRVEPGSRGGQWELCGPAEEPRNPPELSSSAGQWKLVDLALTSHLDGMLVKQPHCVPV